MRNIYILLFILSIYLLSSSCKKENAIDSYRQKLYDCSVSQNPDSITLATNLTGSWKWVSVYSYGSNKAYKADKEVIVVFTSSGTFTATENSVIINKGNWKIKTYSGKTMQLDMDDFCHFLAGDIVLCDNQVMFNNSNVDGDDNLFIRM